MVLEHHLCVLDLTSFASVPEFERLRSFPKERQRIYNGFAPLPDAP